MFNTDNLNDAMFNKFVREFGADDFLFKQSDRGNTMFVIVEGLVKVFYKTLRVDHLVGIYGPGEVIGEKALLSDKPYRRNFSAQAKTTCTLLEFDIKSAKLLTAKLPDLNTKVLSLVSERLDKANELIGILQLPDPLDRFSQYLIYFRRHLSAKANSTQDVTFTASELRYTANLDKDLVDDCVKYLLTKKILIQGKTGLILTDEDALLEHLPSLRERVAA